MLHYATRNEPIQDKEITDSDIEKWARKTSTSKINKYWTLSDDTRYREGLEDGAKAHKRGLIKKGK